MTSSGRTLEYYESRHLEALLCALQGAITKVESYERARQRWESR